MTQKPEPTRLDPHLLAPDHDGTRLVARRRLVEGGLGVGVFSLLTGWAVTNNDEMMAALRAVSRLNDGAQAALFSPGKLARTYAEAEITTLFPFNGFYPEAAAPAIAASEWKLELTGKIADRRARTLADLEALPQESQVTRLICIEGWSAVGKWSGVPLRRFLEAVGADLTAKYVGLRCADGYATSIDMPSALHPQTILATRFLDQPLPTAFGFPMRLRIPTKLGFKNAKHVTELFVTDDHPGGYWEDQGYNWFSGL